MRSAGYSLPELLLVMGLLGVVGSLSVQNGGDLLARQRLEAATRSLEQGINRARAEAIKRQEPCGMQLAERAWQAPPAGSDLEPCFAGSEPWPQGVRVHTTSLRCCGSPAQVWCWMAAQRCCGIPARIWSAA